MNTEDKNINNAAGGRSAYLPPRTGITKMSADCGFMKDELISIPRKDENTGEAYSKQWQDDMEMWDEDDSQNND